MDIKKLEEGKPGLNIKGKLKQLLNNGRTTRVDTQKKRSHDGASPTAPDTVTTETLARHRAKEIASSTVKQVRDWEGYQKQNASSALTLPAKSQAQLGVKWGEKGSFIIKNGEVDVLRVFFTRAPTEIETKIEANLSVKKIPGLATASVQKLGANSPEIKIDLLFSNAWAPVNYAKDARGKLKGQKTLETKSGKWISAGEALRMLEAVILRAWRYSIYLDMGAGKNLVPVAIKGMGFKSSNFIPPGQAKEFQHLYSTATAGNTNSTNSTGDRAGDPQQLVASVEMIVVPEYKYSVPYKARRKASRRRRRRAKIELHRHPAHGGILQEDVISRNPITNQLVADSNAFPSLVDGPNGVAIEGGSATADALRDVYDVSGGLPGAIGDDVSIHIGKTEIRGATANAMVEAWIKTENTAAAFKAARYAEAYRNRPRNVKGESVYPNPGGRGFSIHIGPGAD